LAAEIAYSKTLRKAKEVEIDDSNADELADLLAAASNGTTFVITSDIKLTKTIEVKLEETKFSGRKGNPPIIHCATDSIGFKIRSHLTHVRAIRTLIAGQMESDLRTS